MTDHTRVTVAAAESIHQRSIEFFARHAPYSWRMVTETEEQGRQRTARGLATAEDWADQQHFTFEWTPDHAEHGEWMCAAYDPDRQLQGVTGGVVSSVEDGEPTVEHQRVIEAQLASEIMEEREADNAE